MRILIIHFIPIKKLFWFALKPNRLVDAECTNAIFNFFKSNEVLNYAKKDSWNLQGNIKLPKWGNKLKYADNGICTIVYLSILQLLTYKLYYAIIILCNKFEIILCNNIMQ